MEAKGKTTRFQETNNFQGPNKLFCDGIQVNPVFNKGIWHTQKKLDL